eukprot:GGOE01013090.1.p1 GENE.GGOE01013090.1~~GGOE01013090.1.p1  ORF type:complete len:861 (+),score=186.02 GGOE01013090.1:32-2584(+)
MAGDAGPLRPHLGGSLPTDVLQAMLQFLPARHWCSAALVCAHWGQAVLLSAKTFSLLAAYQSLPSPPQIVPDGTPIPGLNPTTQLHRYQLQTLQAMLQRERWACAPDSAAVPRDPLCFSLLSDPGNSMTETNDDPGGILGEDMGTGKTLICLALVLKTKGTWSAVPNVAVLEWDASFTPPVACYNEYLPPSRTAAPHPESKLWTSCTTLIIVPKLLVDQWIGEINAHTTPHSLGVRVCRTHRDIASLTVPQIVHTDLLLIAQSAIRPEFHGLRRIPSDASQQAPAVSALSRVRFWRIVIDEGHTVGRGASCQTAAISSLAADVRWVCSGTPFPGTTLSRQLEHVGAIMDFLRVSPYNSARYWVQHVRRPMLQRLPHGPRHLLAALTRVMVRTQPAMVAEDVTLPPLTVQEVRLEFRDADEAAHYNEVVSLVRVNLIASRGVGPDSLLDLRNSRQLLVAINNLGYVCTTGEEFAGYREGRSLATEEVRSLLLKGHTSDMEPLTEGNRRELQQLLVALSQRRLPRPSVTASPDRKAAAHEPLFFSAKVEYLMEHLRALVPTHKCIVFTRDNNAIVILRAALAHWGLGNVAVEFHALVPIDSRSGVITAFNYDPTVRIIVMNTLLAAEGISLTAADRIFLLEPLLDHHIEDQAIARAHRIGQLRPVLVEKLIMKGSLEDALARHLAEARDLPWTVSSLARALIRDLRMVDIHRLPVGRALPCPPLPPCIVHDADTPGRSSSSSERTAALKRRHRNVYAACTEEPRCVRRRLTLSRDLERQTPVKDGGSGTVSTEGATPSPVPPCTPSPQRHPQQTVPDLGHGPLPSLLGTRPLVVRLGNGGVQRTQLHVPLML